MAEEKKAAAPPVDLHAYPGSVDIMNYPTEAGYQEYLYDWEEFKIMARSTFKSQMGG